MNRGLAAHRSTMIFKTASSGLFFVPSTKTAKRENHALHSLGEGGLTTFSLLAFPLRDQAARQRGRRAFFFKDKNIRVFYAARLQWRIPDIIL